MKEKINVYLAGSMFCEADRMYNAYLAERIREHFGDRIDLYVPQENQSINDKTKCADSHDIFWGDYNRLKQVFINIIKNSIEALENRNNPNISISYKLKKDYVHVYIEDNGCGMSREVLSRINEPFFTTKGTGTGLGITISQEIIQGHGGIIKYSSKKDLYTKVEVILPIDKQK